MITRTRHVDWECLDQQQRPKAELRHVRLWGHATHRALHHSHSLQGTYMGSRRVIRKR
jgi:hypothetical protein